LMSGHRREATRTLARIVRMRQKLTLQNNNVGSWRRWLQRPRMGIVGPAHFSREGASVMKRDSKTRRRDQRSARRTSAVSSACALALLASQLAPPAYADAYQQARRIYSRLDGVPPSTNVLNAMANDIISNPGNAGLLQAAQVATDPNTGPNFYNVT